MYQDVAQAHWQEWNARIEELTTDARAGGHDATLRRDLAELQRRQYALTGMLGDLQRASDDDWASLQKDLDAMFEAVQRAHERVEERQRGRPMVGRTSLGPGRIAYRR